MNYQVKKKDRKYYKSLAEKARNYYYPDEPVSLRIFIHMVRRLDDPDFFEEMLDIAGR